jgi:hypothetical protein
MRLHHLKKLSSLYTNFGDQEKEYIKAQIQLSESLNYNTYSKNRDNTIYSYNRKRSARKAELAAIESTIDSLERESEIKKREKADREEEKKQYDEYRLNNQKEMYQQSNLDYEKFYKNRYGLVNKLVIIDASQVEGDNSSLQSGFVNLVDRNFSAIDNLKDEISKTTIYKIKGQDSKDEQIRYEKGVISNKPSLEAFKIISIGLYEEENNSSKEYLALNIAFKIRWQVVSPLKYNPSIDAIVDSERERLWKVKNGISSLRSANLDLPDLPEGYRLPNFAELKQFFKSLGGSESDGQKDAFKQVFTWPAGESSIRFISGEKQSSIGPSSKKYKSLRITQDAGYFISEEPEEASEYAPAYVIYVKDSSEN